MKVSVSPYVEEVIIGSLDTTASQHTVYWHNLQVSSKGVTNDNKVSSYNNVHIQHNHIYIL